jgi:phosphate starvation-inducible PhoH-like protein
LVEKIITLENVSLTDFFGIENENIKRVAEAFPNSKVLSRGNEIKIQGSPPEIIKINEIINSLIEHYHQYGRITEDNIKNYIRNDIERVDTKNTLKEEVLIYGTKGVIIKPKTPNQIKLVQAVNKHDIVFALGPAGTGKTYISVALAVRALKNKEVKKIIITRPAVEAGENLGFLPGDLQEKIDPYLRPIFDALDDMIPSEKLKYYQEKRIIEIAPLAYMRGRTLNHAFVLLDEAQNTTPMQMKMFLTRMGPNSKVIVNGDKTQLDLPKNQKSGLDDAMHILSKTEGIKFIHLNEEDVTRHKLVRAIIKAYDAE